MQLELACKNKRPRRILWHQAVMFYVFMVAVLATPGLLLGGVSPNWNGFAYIAAIAVGGAAGMAIVLWWQMRSRA